jgi:hypothetical protein
MNLSTGRIHIAYHSIITNLDWQHLSVVSSACKADIWLFNLGVDFVHVYLVHAVSQFI